MKAFVAQIKGPCRFKGGDVTVSSSYSGEGTTLEEPVSDMLEMMGWIGVMVWPDKLRILPHP